MDQLENTFLKGIEQNQQKLLRVCSVYSLSEEDKKDLFQEVLINIWKSLPTYNGNSSLSTWMFRITLNVCLRLKSKQDKKRLRIKTMDSFTIDRVKSEKINQDSTEQLAQLRNCIKKLNDADKAVITLYLEDLPYKEISQITGLSKNHVAVKVKRIKEKLTSCLKRS